MLDEADAETKRVIDRRELLGVASREIIVDSHDMNRASHECGSDCGQQRRQGLAFARLHFSECAAHHGGAAEQLNTRK